LNTEGATGAAATGGLICSHTAVSCLPGDFCGINTTSLATSAASVLDSVLPNIN
tara:strand:- start:422 stop:583 length:162 start_codon:yes stop_codon:yes gene_type:complete